MTDNESQIHTRQSVASNPPAGRMSSKESTKKHVCKYEGCNKSFTRSDHLQRHSLNHTTGQSTCPRCSVHFNRPDLLDRHLARHKQKDEEAGGYGLGVMETRKRMWRDSEGNIVSKRPTLPQNNPAATSSQEYFSSNGSYLEASYEEDLMNQYTEPLSPPTSMSSASSVKRQQQRQALINNQDEYWDPRLNAPLENGGSLEMCEFLANSSWGSQSFAATEASGVDNDIFNPDTGQYT